MKGLARGQAAAQTLLPTGAAALLVAAIGYVALPWHMGQGGDFLVAGPSGLWLALTRSPWLGPIIAGFVVALVAMTTGKRGAQAGRWFVAAGAIGMAATLLQGFAIDHRGWSFDILAALFGAPGPKQSGFGAGAFVTLGGFLSLACRGLAMQGWCRGDGFVVAAIGWIVALILAFVFFPIARILSSAFQDNAGHLAPGLFVEKIADSSIWGLGCLSAGTSCGVAWNTLFLAVLGGVLSTALGLAFALVATRTGFRFR